MSKQMIKKKFFRGHSGCCNAPNYGPSTVVDPAGNPVPFDSFLSLVVFDIQWA